MNDIHKALNVLRTAFCAVILFVCPVNAQEIGYTVENVEVDVTADNAVMAREKAFEKAQVEAFSKLINQYLPEEQKAGWTPPDVNTVSGFVQDFEVSNEQLSATRYKGTYTFRFRRNAVDQYIGSNAYTMAEAPNEVSHARPILVLPYLRTNQGTYLWSDQNLFQQAWVRLAQKGVPLSAALLPMGDILDINQVSENNPFQIDSMKIQQMVRRYNADHAMIAIAEPKQDQSIALSLYKVRTQTPDFIKTEIIGPLHGLPDTTLFEEAVRATYAAVQGQIFQISEQQNQTSVRPEEQGPSENFQAKARFSNVKEWVRLKQAIENTQNVRGVQVQGLKPKEAVIKIQYSGSFNSLSAGFIQSGLSFGLDDQENPYQAELNGGQRNYVISLSGRS